MTDLPVWVRDYRGRPFVRGSEGPDGYDCYGIVRAVLRDHFGREAPCLSDRWTLEARSALAAAHEAWEPIHAHEQPGDVLAFVIPTQRELHVGIVVAPGWMLHARAGEGVRTERTDRLPWLLLREGPAWRLRVPA